MGRTGRQPYCLAVSAEKRQAARIGLGIAGFGLGFKSDHAGIISVLRRRYAPFAVRTAGGIAFDCSPGLARQTPFRPEIKWIGPCLELARGDFKASLDTGSGRGRLTAAANEQCLDAFLRSLISSLLIREGGLMLHSAGLLKGGKAWLFPGVSGAGKSTLSKLAAAAGAEVISDEINMLRFEGGRPMVYGSPFWGEMRAGGRRGRWPLGGLFLPKKAERCAVSGVAPSVILKALLRCTVNFSRAGQEAAASLLAASRLLQAAPARRLGFSRENADFMELLK